MKKHINKAMRGTDNENDFKEALGANEDRGNTIANLSKNQQLEDMRNSLNE